MDGDKVILKETKNNVVIIENDGLPDLRIVV